MLLLSTAALALTHSAVRMGDVVTATRQTQQALRIARGMLEGLRSGLDPSSLGSASSMSAWSGPAAANEAAAFEVSWSYASVDGSPTPITGQRIGVRVTWQDHRGLRQAVQLDTFIGPWLRQY